MKKYIIKENIPNLLTFLNLSFGILSIIETVNYNYITGAIFIMAAALLDRYDGKIARMFNVSSEIGKQLDSLSDLVSFGVAPGMLIFFKYNLNFYFAGVIAMIFYILCGAYRLAKYNISTFNGVFTGVPITVTGCALALLSLLFRNSGAVMAVSMAVFGYLMVSQLKLKKV